MKTAEAANLAEVHGRVAALRADRALLLEEWHMAQLALSANAAALLQAGAELCMLPGLSVGPPQ